MPEEKRGQSEIHAPGCVVEETSWSKYLATDNDGRNKSCQVSNQGHGQRVTGTSYGNGPKIQGNHIKRGIGTPLNCRGQPTHGRIGAEVLQKSGGNA